MYTKTLLLLVCLCLWEELAGGVPYNMTVRRRSQRGRVQMVQQGLQTALGVLAGSAGQVDETPSQARSHHQTAETGRRGAAAHTAGGRPTERRHPAGPGTRTPAEGRGHRGGTEQARRSSQQAREQSSAPPPPVSGSHLITKQETLTMSSPSVWSTSAAPAAPTLSPVRQHGPAKGLLLQQRDKRKSPSRNRRSWIWNQFFVIEEYSGPEPVLIGRLRTDMDRGDGRTKYVLRGEGAGSVFVIDEMTGNIHVTKPLDREEKDEYRLTATATDRQTERPLEPSSQFIIRVQDINDNPPVFQQGPYSASIPEMSNIGTSIIQVTATDADDPTYGNSAKLVYTLSQGQHYFSVDPQTGILRTAVPDMDREAQDEYVAVLQAKDMGGHLGGLSGTTTVTVRLTDVNDNPPRFIHSTWSFSVSELAVPGAEVGRVSATDADLGHNAEMEFTIVDSEGSDTFNLTRRQQEAIITLNKAVDYELRKSYSFSVEVVNPTVDPRFLRRGPFKDRSVVRVLVLDADEPPRFSRSHYTLAVSENCDPPCPVGRVDAVDPDTGLSSSVRFSIDPQSDPETLFRISSDSGLISTTTELDRERQQWHNVTVIATQRDTPNQVSRVAVAIETLDMNDNAPELDRQYTTTLCDSTPVGQVVQVLRAIDRDDVGNDSVIHFSIPTESRFAKNFSVRESGGATASLVLLSPLPSLSHSASHSLTLQLPLLLRDSVSPLSSTGTLTVSVCSCTESVCVPLPSSTASPGLSTAALLAILACVATLLVVSMLSAALRRQKRDSLSPLEEDDVRENIITYDDEGGGEADTAAFDIVALQNAPHTACRGYLTLDSRNVRCPQQDADGSRTLGWTLRSGSSVAFCGRLCYSTHTPPIRARGHAEGEEGTDEQEQEAAAVATHGESDNSTKTRDNHSPNCEQQQRLEDKGSSASCAQVGGASSCVAELSSRRSSAEPAKPPSSSNTEEQSVTTSESHQAEPSEAADDLLLARAEVGGVISLSGTPYSLYRKGAGLITDWHSRVDLTGYVLGRRDIVPSGAEPAMVGASALSLKVGEFLRLRLAQVTFDPSLPPYDSVQIYGFEGEGSPAGSLSSLESESSQEDGWSRVAEWGCRFNRLAHMIQERRPDGGGATGTEQEGGAEPEEALPK